MNDRRESDRRETADRRVYRPSIAERIVWSSQSLRSADMQVLLALASCGDWETGQRCHPSVLTIVARSGLSRATVTRALASLRDKTQPGGPWIVMTAWRRRHATTYDICLNRLATHPPKERQIPMTTHLLDPVALKAHDPVKLEAQNEPLTELEAQNEPQGAELEAQNEPPTSLPDLYLEERTHTPRAREVLTAHDEPPTSVADLPLIGQPPPPRCAHPHAHAWCEGRVHVPRDLHFELLDRLGSFPGETRAEKAGRLIAFYAADQAQLHTATSIEDPYTYWKTAFKAWIARPAHVRERRSGSECRHTPACETRTEHLTRTLADIQADRRKFG